MNRGTAISQKILELYMGLVPAAFVQFKSLTAETGLTIANFRVLMGVSMGLNRVGKLAELNDISQPAMSKMVDALVSAGFLKRVPHPNDRRQVELQLTRKAAAALAKHRQELVKKMAYRISTLSAHEQRALDSGVQVLLSLLPDRRPLA